MDKHKPAAIVFSGCDGLYFQYNDSYIYENYNIIEYKNKYYIFSPATATPELFSSVARKHFPAKRLDPKGMFNPYNEPHYILLLPGQNDEFIPRLGRYDVYIASRN